MASEFLKKHQGNKTEAKGEKESKGEVAKVQVDRVVPDSIVAYYLVGKGVYLTQNEEKEWMPFSEGEIARLLRNRHFMSTREKWQAASEIDREMYRIQMQHNVHFAGELAGYDSGPHLVGGHRALVTRSRKKIVASDVDWPIIDKFLTTMFGKTLPFFMGWLKGSLDSLEAGFPWRPGQVLGLCGGINCGKSLLQKIITEVLGGRFSDPTLYLTGGTNFNEDVFRAEHLTIGDKELPSMSHVKRRQFAAKLKTLIVEPAQYFRSMFNSARMLTPFIRLSISANETPESLAIFPNPDDDVADKLLLLKCQKGDLPARTDNQMTWKAQWDMILKEIPGFVSYLGEWRLPRGYRDPEKRFTVKSFIAPEIKPLMANLGKEQRLFELFDILDLSWESGTFIKGTSAEIETRMRKRDTTGELDRLAEHHAQFGYLLGRLCKLYKDRFMVVGKKGHQNIYKIIRSKFRLEL